MKRNFDFSSYNYINFTVNRAQRRHHIERLKERRKKYWFGFKTNPYMDERFLGIAVNTPKPCNCWMCSKPKKHTESIQEIRENQIKLHDFDLDSDE